MNITQSMVFEAGSRAFKLLLEKGISFNSVETIIEPLLLKQREQSEELHYRTVLLLSDILERATTEEEAIKMIQEKFPE